MYKKAVKRRIKDRVFRKGDTVELDRLEGAYPENWFELVKEEEKKEIEEEPKVKTKKTKKEVDTYGIGEDTDTDLER